MESALITRGNRPLTNGRHYIRVPVPAEMAEKLQRGFTILDGYSYLLSERGRQLAQRVDRFFMTAEQLPAIEVQNQAQEWIGQLPSLQRPQLELFKEPDPKPFEAAIEIGARRVKAEIMYGCENFCVFCVSDAPQKLKFMPYPMLLGIAETAKRFERQLKIDFSRSEPLQYRDLVFGADFSDVAKAIFPDTNILELPQSHGWPREHKFAQAAAEKLNAMGKEFWRISVHFFHKEFLCPEIRAQALFDFAEQFTKAIALLKPRVIGFRGLAQYKMGFAYRFSLNFLVRLFKARIFPDLPAELRERYGEDLEKLPDAYERTLRFPDNCSRIMAGESFELMPVTGIKHRYQRIFEKNGAALLWSEPPGDCSGRYNYCIDHFIPGELLIFSDGHYVINEYGFNLNAARVTRQEGKLF